MVHFKKLCIIKSLVLKGKKSLNGFFFFFFVFVWYYAESSMLYLSSSILL